MFGLKHKTAENAHIAYFFDNCASNFFRIHYYLNIVVDNVFQSSARNMLLIRNGPIKTA